VNSTAPPVTWSPAGNCAAPVAEAYTERFRLGGEFENAIARSTLYRFDPAGIRYIDNSERFGYRFELRPSRSRPLRNPTRAES
jgi:hypothetical protein